MKAIILFALISVLFKSINAGAWSSCKVEGIPDVNWLMGYTRPETIDDTHEGVVAIFKTSKILAMEVTDLLYLDATFENDTLTIFTTERFKNFEKEAKHSWTYGRIEIGFYTDCEGGSSDFLKIYQKVNDVNNHDPILNHNRYEFDFSMTIPKDFDLTEFLTISASDDDFTNDAISFSVEEINLSDKNLKIRSAGKTIYGNDDDYFTSLTALQNVTAPFKAEFTLVATDGGEPKRSSKATVIINVANRGENNESNEASDEEPENSIHPPVFTKHIYFADYTLENKLKLDESITIKYGATDKTIVRQSDYNEYFKISLTASTGNLEVEVVKALTDEIMQEKYIVIEIEAENPGLSIPGRTALLINMPKESNNSEDSDEDEENNIHPPVFSQQLYFANYTLKHTLHLEQVIMIKYGATDNMIVRQSNYTEYFNVRQSAKDQLAVETIKDVPDSLLHDLMIIEIEVENRGLSIPARTALIIRPQQNETKDCELNEVWGFNYGSNVLPIILFFCALVFIVFANILVLALYFRKQKANNAVCVNAPTRNDIA